MCNMQRCECHLHSSFSLGDWPHQQGSLIAGGSMKQMRKLWDGLKVGSHLLQGITALDDAVETAWH